MQKFSKIITVKQLIQLRRSQGLCDMCGNVPVPGMARCNKCGIAHRRAERERTGCQPNVKTGVGRKPIYEGEEL